MPTEAHTFGQVSAHEPLQRTIVDNLRFNLASIRKARGLSQAQLGEASGITRNHYQLLESGRTATGDLANPRLSTLVSIARVLEVPPTVLLETATPFAVWRWFIPRSSVDDDLMQEIFEHLVSASESHLDGDGAAFIGRDGATIAMAIGVRAPHKQIARLVGQQLISEAVDAAGGGRFKATTRVDQDVDALVRSGDA